MRMAGADVAPGVEDGDHRLALPVGVVVADLHGARSVPEGAQVVGREPARRAELVVGLAGHFSLRSLRGDAEIHFRSLRARPALHHPDVLREPTFGDGCRVMPGMTWDSCFIDSTLGARRSWLSPGRPAAGGMNEPGAHSSLIPAVLM